MIWSVILLLLGSLLVVLLCLPLQLEIDTERALYRASWSQVFKIQAFPDENGWHWSFMFFNRQIKFKSSPKKSAKEKPATKKKTGSSFFTSKKTWQLLKNGIAAIQLKRLHINWDTGDFVRNAYLFPVFHVISSGPILLSINFMGRQEFVIHLQTRLYRMASAFLRTYISSKF